MVCKAESRGWGRGAAQFLPFSASRKVPWTQSRAGCVLAVRDRARVSNRTGKPGLCPCPQWLLGVAVAEAMPLGGVTLEVACAPPRLGSQGDEGPGEFSYEHIQEAESAQGLPRRLVQGWVTASTVTGLALCDCATGSVAPV